MSTILNELHDEMERISVALSFLSDRDERRAELINRRAELAKRYNAIKKERQASINAMQNPARGWEMVNAIPTRKG